MDQNENNEESKMDYQENKSEEWPILNVECTNNAPGADLEPVLEPRPIETQISNRARLINIKTCDFDTLLNNISHNLVFKNIFAIYSFLKGNDEELEFREVNVFEEELIVRIIRNVEVLRSQKMHRSCMRFSYLIINMLKNAILQRIFMVACFYKNENSSVEGHLTTSKILVYKKLYYKNNETQVEMNNVESLMSTTSPAISRSASMDSLHSQRSNFDPNPKNPQLNPFISDCLHIMLHFVKDITQPNLNFIDFCSRDIVFLHSVFSSVINENFDNFSMGKSVYRPLWEAVKIFSLKYEFRIRNLKCSLNTKSLLLEKRTKKEVANIENRMLTNKKYNKVAKRHQEFLKRLSTDFILSTLMKVQFFLTEESQASLVIHINNKDEKKLVKNVINFARSPNIRCIFTDEPRRIFENINTMLSKKNNYRIKVCDKHVYNDVKFMKIPVFEDMPPPPPPKRSCDVSLMNKPMSNDAPPKKVSRPWYPKIETVSKKSTKEAKLKDGGHVGFWERHSANTTSDQPSTSSAVNQSTIKDKKSSSSNISFRTAGAISPLTTDTVLTEMIKKYGAKDNKIFEPPGKKSAPIKSKSAKLRSKECRKDQLIEALSVPVQSDKALKMMRCMGWKGGALGPRGNGITEPIMPHLDTGSGAGLGHTKKTQNQPPKLQKSVKETPIIINNNKRNKKITDIFKISYLNQLLQFVISKEESKIVNFILPLNKNEFKYVEKIIKMFASRKLAKTDGAEQVIKDNIMKEYKKQSGMVITACTSDDRKQLSLTKLFGVTKKHHLIAQRKPDTPVTTTMLNNLTEFKKNYLPLFYAQKKLDESLIVSKYLIEIWLMLENKKDQIIVTYDKPLTGPESSYIRKGISRLNSMNRFPGQTLESKLATRVKAMMGWCYFNLDCGDDNKTFIITKKMRKGAHEETSATTTCDERSDYDTDGYEYYDETDENSEKINVNDKKTNENDEKINESDEKINESDEKINEAVETLNDTEGDVKMKENDNDKAQNVVNKEQMSETEDNIVLNVKNHETSVVTENVDNNMKNYENKTENENQNTQPGPNVSKNINAKVKITQSDEKINKSDGIMSTDDAAGDEHYKKLSTISVNDYSTDDISVSGFTTVGCSDTDDSEISGGKMISDDKLKSDNINLSVKSSNKESQTDLKSDVKIVYLTKKVFSNDTPKEIQGLLSLEIMKTKELPLLNCHGIHRDALVYSCHNKKTFDFLHNMCVANDIIFSTKMVDSMSLKINSFFDVDEKYLFELLELYNKGISTKEWIVLKKEKMDDSFIFDVKMDKKSFDCVLESNLALYAGVDKVTFSIIYE